MREELLCPSAPGDREAVVIGAVRADGTVDYLRQPLAVSDRFLQLAGSAGPAESRFRFSSPCRQAACAQWTGDSCGLPARLTDALPTPDPAEPLPRCAIRATCRWFHQSGTAACRICPLVTTRDDESTTDRTTTDRTTTDRTTTDRTTTDRTTTDRTTTEWSTR